MAGKGDIAKIALDAIIRPATIPLVTPQQELKLSRGVFKDMLKQLRRTRDYYRNETLPEWVATRSYENPELFRRWSPNYGKQTEQRFAAIDNILKKRNTDPAPLISEAVSTGRINGMKLSSQERNELAARLQVLNAYKTGEMPYPSGYGWDTLSPSELFYMPSYKRMNNPAEIKMDDIRKAYNDLERNATRGSALQKMAIAGYNRNIRPEEELILNTPLTSSGYDFKDMIDREVFGHKGTYGKGYMNRYHNKDINWALRTPTIYNSIVQNYGITDKKVGETIYSLLPEWTGSIDDLVNIARMLNP